MYKYTIIVSIITNSLVACLISQQVVKKQVVKNQFNTTEKLLIHSHYAEMTATFDLTLEVKGQLPTKGQNGPQRTLTLELQSSEVGTKS